MLEPAVEKQGANQPHSTAWSVLLVPAEGSRRFSSLLEGGALGVPPAAAVKGVSHGLPGGVLGARPGERVEGLGNSGAWLE